MRFLVDFMLARRMGLNFKIVAGVPVSKKIVASSLS
jgi:hypothetical protein